MGYLSQLQNAGLVQCRDVPDLPDAALPSENLLAATLKLESEAV
jgi:hypothetical protein